MSGLKKKKIEGIPQLQKIDHNFFFKQHAYYFAIAAT